MNNLTIVAVPASSDIEDPSSMVLISDKNATGFGRMLKLNGIG